MTRLGSKLRSVHEALDGARLPHAFGGAIALAYCTADVRATVDIDVNLFVPVARKVEVFSSLPTQIVVDDQARANADDVGQVRLRWDDTAIDLFFSYHRFHEHVAARVRTVPFEGIEIPVLDCTDIVIFKTLFGRQKDWLDIESVVDNGAADPAETLRWIAEMLGPDSPQYLRLSAIFGGERGAGAGRPFRAFGKPDSPKG